MKEIFTSMYDDQAYQEDPAVDYGRPYNGPQLPVRRSCTGWISKQGTCVCFILVPAQVGVLIISSYWFPNWNYS